MLLSRNEMDQLDRVVEERSCAFLRAVCNQEAVPCVLPCSVMLPQKPQVALLLPSSEMGN